MRANEGTLVDFIFERVQFCSGFFEFDSRTLLKAGHNYVLFHGFGGGEEAGCGSQDV